MSSFLLERPLPYFCTDLIATEFQHLDPVSQQIAAGREFLRRIESQLSADEDSIVESTLSGRTLRNYLVRARSAGLSISIVFIFLDAAETCIVRVRERVRRGGHHVPESDVRRRFARSCTNFWHIYAKIADQWLMFYNAGSGLIEVAFGTPREFTVSDDDLFGRFRELLED